MGEAGAMVLICMIRGNLDEANQRYRNSLKKVIGVEESFVDGYDTWDRHRKAEHRSQVSNIKQDIRLSDLSLHLLALMSSFIRR